jgi:hypothetical protein
MRGGKWEATSDINILARKLHNTDGHVKARWGGRWDKIVINGVVLEVTSEKHGDAKRTSTLVECRFNLGDSASESLKV